MRTSKSIEPICTGSVLLMTDMATMFSHHPQRSRIRHNGNKKLMELLVLKNRQMNIA